MATEGTRMDAAGEGMGAVGAGMDTEGAGMDAAEHPLPPAPAVAGLCRARCGIVSSGLPALGQLSLLMAEPPPAPKHRLRQL